MVPSQTNAAIRDVGSKPDKRCNPRCPASTRSQTAEPPASLIVTSIAQVHRCERPLKRHSSTFTCARTRLWLSMQTQRALAPRPKQPSNAPSHATCPSSAIWVLARSTLTHACLRHMLTNVTRVAAQPRLNATLSRTCSKPHHLAFRMSLHPPMKTPTSQCTTRLRTHANTTEQTKRRSVQQLEQDRTTQAPSQMHLSTSNHAPHPKPERQPTPLACPHRVLLRVDLGQTDRRTGPKRPDIAPIPSRRKQPRTCLKGRARPHSFL